jgi:3-deoxy-D-manno-octulosonate 8-phosphate phosphatase KdsC-like HAD superfamily phosphatase
VTRACGGHGAVREAIEWVLQLRGGKEEVYKSVIGGS